MNYKKRHILFLDTGFKYDMGVTYGPKLRQLSGAFQGAVITFGEVGFFRFGSFSVHSFSVLKSKFCIFWRALCHARRHVRRSRRNGVPVDFVVSYDATNTGLLGLLLRWMTGVPLIVEVNGDVASWSNYADVHGYIKRRLKRWLYIRIASFVMRRAQGIKLLYRAQIEHLPLRLSPRTVVHTFPNFLDLSEFRNLREEKRVAIVGFPFAVKGIDIAVHAFKAISSQFPDWRLEVLGWYEGAEKEVLDRCIAGHPQIAHVEAIYKRDMPAYLGTCGVVLCASRTEGFPRVIKEAMYAGKPCIVSRVGGLPDVFEHGVNGLLFQSEDPASLAEQLYVMLSDEVLRARLGDAARCYAYAHFTNEAYMEHMRSFTENIRRMSVGDI